MISQDSLDVIHAESPGKASHSLTSGSLQTVPIFDNGPAHSKYLQDRRWLNWHMLAWQCMLMMDEELADAAAVHLCVSNASALAVLTYAPSRMQG